MTLALVLAAPAMGQETAPASAQVQPAQPAPTPEDEAAEENVIVVTASRLPGQVQTDVPPVVELDEADIAAVGASSLDDLIAQLAPQTGSGRGRGGRPVFLVNGQRVSGFRELRRYPPEAIRKVEVYPEEVALQFGYPADQRVINFILKDNFASREIEAEYGGPTAGGRASGEVEASILTINGPNRLSLAAEYNTSSLLTEAERGIIQTEGSTPTVAGDPDPAAFRSLASDAETLEVEGTWNTGFGEGADAATLSVNGSHARSFSRSLSGFDTVLLTDGAATELRAFDANPIERRTRTITTQAASTFNKPLGDWNLSVTADGGVIRSVSEIDRRRDGQILQDLVDAGELAIDGPLPAIAGAGRDRSASTATNATTLATLRGTPILLPAGELGVTFDTGYDWNRIASTDTRAAVGETILTRGDLSAGINLGVPIASAREGFLAPLGELNLNLGAGINELSDFGTLTDWTTGLNWRPTERLSLQASYTSREVAPNLSQLGDPQITNVNVPTFDLRNGETVLANVITGGNPNLLAETQRDIKLSASYDIDLFDRANFIVEYFRNSSDDVTEGFPFLTPEIEAAFPDRVVRDGDGSLVSIDRRPITFASRKSSRIRYGFNVFGKVGREQPEGSGESEPRGPMAMVAQAEPATSGARTGGFDPARMAELRAQFCGANAQPFDPSQLPERMQQRLRGADGQIDPARVETVKARFCSADGAEGFDPQRMAATRAALCSGYDPKNPGGAALPDLSTLPERFQQRLRGADGQVDPARVAELRARVCATPEAAQADGEARGGRGQGGGGGRGGGGGGFGGMGGGGDGQGRWNLSLYHSIELDNTALIAPGIPELDLLDGDALGSGGVSRHRLELEGGVFHKGLGVRLSGVYNAGTTVDGSGLPGSSDLSFGDLATFNLRAFANLDQQKWLVGDEPGFFKSTRISLGIRNIFDAQQRVTDQNGLVPLSYQPGLVDPIGRSVEIDFRKVF